MSEKTNENALANITRKVKATSKDMFTRAVHTFKRMDKPARILVLVLFIAVAAEIPIFLSIGSTISRPPVLSGATPAASLTMEEGESVVFNVAATDPDGDALSYQWTLNGVPVGGNQASFTFSPDFTMGGIPYIVKLAVSDGKNRVDQAWAVNVTNILTRLCDVSFGDIEELYVVGDKVFFFHEYYSSDELVQLWCSDGSTEGTRLVMDLADHGPDVEEVYAADDAFYFTFWDDQHTSEIWKTDGTSVGTAPFTDFSMPNPQIYYMYAWGDWIYFNANNDTTNYGAELWKSDGTTTVLVKDIYPGGGDSYPYNFYAAGNRLFFTANNGSGATLWCTDGTEIGTKPVKNLVVNDEFSMCTMGTSLFAFATNGTTGYELWKIDSTGTDAVLVKDICNGPTGCNPDYMTAKGNMIYFSADNGINGIELWKSDGTMAGTVMVKDINADATSTDIESISFFGNIILFEGSDADHGSELWRSDGTAAGTYRVKDIYPGSGSNSSYPYIEEGYSYGIGAGRVIFPAADGVHGTELWSSDGTEAGTRLEMDIYKDIKDSDPDYFRTIGNAAFFFANNGKGDGLYVY